MKFGKEFKSQMVPEWQAAYLDYNALKMILKDIKWLLHSPPGPTCPKRKASLYNTFHGLTNRHSLVGHHARNDDEVIMVSSVRDDDEQQQGAETRYQTLLVRPSEQAGDQEVIFFEKLDDEFNKVNMFYKSKENEVVAEAVELSRQMNSLIDLRVKVEKPHLVGVASRNQVELEATNTAPTTRHSMSSIRPDMDVTEEIDTVSEVDQEGSRREEESRQRNNGDFAINVEPETQKSSVKGILKTFILETSSSKTELKKAEVKMTEAFITFHHKLRLLKSYSFLNELALSEIMKKYDKITSRKASKPYLKMVDNSYIGKSDEINMLIEKVETTFIKHFAHGNREKGMKKLKLKPKKERQSVTFLTGVFSGCGFALMVAVIVTLHVRDLLPKSSPNRNKYMENIFPLYSFFGFLVLHLLMYAANIYFWMRYQINYPFIFGFKKGTELRYWEVLLVASGLAMLMFGCILLHLNMEIDPSTRNYKRIIELLPLLLLVVVLLVTFCPFNIMYRSSRFFLLKCMFHCICAPFYTVTLPDFFMADQLTSQGQALRSLEFFVCYYGWGDFMNRTNTCMSNKVYQGFFIIAAAGAFWIRCLQCLRRFYEENDKLQGINAIKYFLTVVAISLVTLFDLKQQVFLRIIATIVSTVATIMLTYWDIVFDWGLLTRNSKNKWLRDRLIIKNKTVYYLAIAEDAILRMAWMQVILGWREFPYLHRKGVTAIMGCLEIFRRGVWNFFRIENEHLNNVGKYRAFNAVPLPFQQDEDKSM